MGIVGDLVPSGCLYVVYKVSSIHLVRVATIFKELSSQMTELATNLCLSLLTSTTLSLELARTLLLHCQRVVQAMPCAIFGGHACSLWSLGQCWLTIGWGVHMQPTPPPCHCKIEALFRIKRCHLVLEIHSIDSCTTSWPHAHAQCSGHSSILSLTYTIYKEMAYLACENEQMIIS